MRERIPDGEEPHQRATAGLVGGCWKISPWDVAEDGRTRGESVARGMARGALKDRRCPSAARSPIAIQWLHL
jgi:hypothetical protein